MGGIDPKLTEKFLRAQPMVVDASVWIQDGRMSAHVTVLDDTPTTANGIKALCAENLGLHQTPSQIMLIHARSRAA